MPSTTVQKLKIKQAYTLLAINAPGDFEKELGHLPDGVRVTSKAKTYNQIHWFVKDKTQLESEVVKVVGMLLGSVTCWIYYPKGSSKIQTDLTRDKGWESLLKHDHLQWISLISFNDTWSAFGMRLKTESDKRKEATPKEREIFNYIDAAKKILNLPDNFTTELKQNAKAQAFFNTLSFTNRKEYVEWIVTAKRDDTKATRVKQSIERLHKGWKNPANR